MITNYYLHSTSINIQVFSSKLPFSNSNCVHAGEEGAMARPARSRSCRMEERHGTTKIVKINLAEHTSLEILIELYSNG